jgi:glutamate-1-semialdehyde 2,1-aminomutase
MHRSLPWGDLGPWEAELEKDDVAAVIVASEYETMEMGREFLHGLRRLTTEHGTLMVMDEIVTGFRVAVGGIHEHFQFAPDLAVFAKGLANGMPLSAYVGRGDLLDLSIDLRISSTFGGEVLSLAAAEAVLDFYVQHAVIEHMWHVGERLRSGMARLFGASHSPARVAGYPVCFALVFDDPRSRESFFRACYRSGVCLYDTVYVSFAHKEDDIAESLARIEVALSGMTL